MNEEMKEKIKLLTIKYDKGVITRPELIEELCKLTENNEDNGEPYPDGMPFYDSRY